MRSFKNVTPAEIEAAFQEQKERLPIYSETAALAAAVVVRPDLAHSALVGMAVQGLPARAVAERQPWSWLGCETCRVVDARAASLFGGRRILPLGQHSIMNGVRHPAVDA